MDGKWNTSVQELIDIFSQSLKQLIPVMDKAHIKWRGNEAYDDWDEIKRVLFSNIVVNSIVNSNIGIYGGTFARFSAYPKEGDSIFISFDSTEHKLPDYNIPILLDIESISEPFDVVKYALYSEKENNFGDSINTISSSSCQFKVVFLERGKIIQHYVLTVDL
ncbi:hypothetical protein [Deinococcus aluminii]|uniref:hypothetical protein n=1 Tax=Deinococcus aluminii TaxID=1656885 RepID=UPI0031F0BEB3